MHRSKTPFQRHLLPSGLRVITIPRPEAITTNILVLAETGSKYESKGQSGISHFLEHMFFKGTKRRPNASDIAMELDALGAQYNAYTSQEYTGYYATVEPKLAKQALEILADMYLNPIFPETEIAKEAGVIIEEINMYEDMPRDQVQQLFQALLYGDQPAGRSILGTKESVRSFRRNDFLEYHANHYVTESTVVVVAGKFNEGVILKQIEREFRSLRRQNKTSKAPVNDKQSQVGILTKFKKTDQSHLIIGVRTFSARDRQTETTDLLAAVLGGSMSSRLFLKIREELGAAYYVRAENDSSTDHGFLEIAVGVDRQRVPEIVKVILEECRKLREKLVPEKELVRAKQTMTGNLFLGLERSASLAGFYGTEEIIKGKLISPESQAKKIKAVTAQEIKSVAQEIFQTERLNLALVGPKPEAGLFERSLRL